MKILKASLLWILAICACQPSAKGQTPPGESLKLAIRVNLERQKDDRWQRVDPKTVFHAGDAIRFRFETSLGGYLYVLNHSSDGDVSWLFPRSGEGQESRVEPGPEYLVPGAKSSFVVGGKAGFDVTYWILSPVPIDMGHAAPPALGTQVNTLEPRCRSETLKARGLCTDERAGPRPFTRTELAPLGELEGKPLVSRELKFERKDDTTRISLRNPHAGVVVYEFLIAHD